MSDSEIIIDTGEIKEDEPPQSQISVVDLLKKDLSELEEAKDVFIPIEGYESTGLAANYRLPRGGKELDEIVRRVFRTTKDEYERGVNITIDTMISLCLGLWVQLPDMEERKPLDFDGSGIPVKYDTRLADNLGWVLPEGQTSWTARLIVRKLFANNELMIGAHSQQLQRWLQNTKVDMQTSFWDELGEIQAVR